MNAAENARLTQVGPGTPMGGLMREHWLPACLASELKPGGAPMRLMLLGEKLVAFRGPDGRVGVLEHACPHRGVSLFYGRNEEGGLRCVYHGWKFAADGVCLEQPNVPAQFAFADRVQARAYPAVERNGVVWTYLGARTEPPPLTAIEAMLLPQGEVRLSCSIRTCNYLQVLEGEIDTSHFGFLHGGAVAEEDLDPADLNSLSLKERAPNYHVRETEWGTMYAAYREANADEIYYRVAHFLLPFYTMFPDGLFERNIVCDAAVPMDDTHTMIFTWMYRGRTAGVRKLKDGRPIPGLERDEAYLPNGTGWFDRWRTVANEANDYLIDRDAQAGPNYSGLTGVQLQDQAMVESMGPIVDRTREHLSASDRMIVVTRKRLLAALEAHAGGAPPATAVEPRRLQQARSGAYLAPAGRDWFEAYADQLRRAHNPTDVLHLQPGAAE
jgi:phenylpropionate dioxygenase-like ring-hydroxylating dioxygenase large terminal subunit